MKFLITCLSLLFMLVSCNDNSGEVSDFSSLDGNNYLMTVDRIADHPAVSLPSDKLNESNYVGYTDDKTYTVYFSGDGGTVTLEPGHLGGIRTETLANAVSYKLNENVFAGGRFMVWLSDGNFEAELTIYGSGVPIVLSERGNLVPE